MYLCLAHYHQIWENYGYAGRLTYRLLQVMNIRAQKLILTNPSSSSILMIRPALVAPIRSCRSK